MWTNHGLKIMNLNVNLPMFLSAGTDDGHPDGLAAFSRLSEDDGVESDT